MESLYLPSCQAYLRYHDLPGQSPALVYLHGLGSASSADYPGVVAHAPLNRYRSLLVDLLGFGFSDRPKKFRYTLDSHAVTVAQLLDHLELGECGVIGHSMGGSVAIALAAMRPDLVGRLVVAEGNLDPGGGVISSPIARQTEWGFALFGHAAMLRQVRAMALRGRSGSTAYLATVRASAPYALYRTAVGLVRGTDPTMRERFLALSIPRAFIFGERSLPDPDADFLAGQGVKVLIVPEAGHAMMDDNPSGFARAIGEALGE